MAYYLDKAPMFKEQIKALKFTEQQLNLLAKMMLSCTVLRQRKPIINLVRCSLPENFEMDLITQTSSDGERSWQQPLVKAVKLEAQQ